MVTDQQLKKCHANISGCEISGSTNEKKCVESCNLNNKEVIVSKKCRECIEYYSTEEKSCKETCPKDEIRQREETLLQIHLPHLKIFRVLI